MKVKFTGPRRTFDSVKNYEYTLALKYEKKHGKYPIKNEHLKTITVSQIFKREFLWVKDTLLNAAYYPTKFFANKRKIHIDAFDVWNADHTIGLVVHPILLKLKEKMHGAAMVDDIDVPDHLKDSDILKKDPNAESKVHEKWEWVLGEIIFAFEHIGPKAYSWEREYETGEMGGLVFEDSDHDGFRTVNVDMGDFVSDDVGKDAVRKRITNGLMLFAKYHSGLWD